MEKESFQKWLDLYRNAWTSLDPILITNLFSKNAKYYEKPFMEPFSGLGSIKQYWEIVSQTQKNVTFDYEIIGLSNDTGVAHWKASFERKQQKIALDGVLVAQFDPDGKCRSFREWWTSQKTPI